MPEVTLAPVRSPQRQAFDFHVSPSLSAERTPYSSKQTNGFLKKTRLGAL